MSQKFDRLPVWLAKIILPEFWSSYIIYTQAFLFVSWHTLKNKNRFYPVLLNPAIDNTGGFANPSKSKINTLFPAHYLPKSLEWNSNENVHTFISECSEKIGFPCFIKPDNLYQGIGVQKIYSKEEMVQYLNQYTANCTVQAFVDLQEEFAVFITKFPGETLKIQSLVQKEFLTITGNGKDNIQQLLEKKLRYRMARKKINPFWGHRFIEIPAIGENLLIQPVGNHNRGTCFYNISHQINANMEQLFHQIVPESGIYYGRFDVKAKDLQSLETGEQLLIIEFNGTIAEPVAYLDPTNSFFKAQKIVMKHYKEQLRIGKELLAQKQMAPGLLKGISIIRNTKNNKIVKAFTFEGLKG